MIKTILWDIDGTLLNFQAAESAAIRECFRQFGLGECTDGMVARYSVLNDRYWKMLENGEKTKSEILTGRFEEFFRREGVECARIPEFNAEYQLRLGDTICFNDDCYALIESLRGRVKQYVVTNGTVVAQAKKLERSGLGALLDGAFISDQIGAEKPSKVFFDAVFATIGRQEPDEVIIVGDSLTSDMRGGCNAGILTCWYNPQGKINDLGVRVDVEIRRLQEVEALLDGEPGRGTRA
ncbi:MAG: YjjG family noncanonical pyrimidine nucleotidase [Oscillospiraceae bacterium]